MLIFLAPRRIKKNKFFFTLRFIFIHNPLIILFIWANNLKYYLPFNSNFFHMLVFSANIAIFICNLDSIFYFLDILSVNFAINLTFFNNNFSRNINSLIYNITHIPALNILSLISKIKHINNRKYSRIRLWVFDFPKISVLLN